MTRMTLVVHKTFWELADELALEASFRRSAYVRRAGSAPPSPFSGAVEQRLSARSTNKRPAPDANDVDACCAEIHGLLQAERWDFLSGRLLDRYAAACRWPVVVGKALERAEAEQHRREAFVAELWCVLPRHVFEHWRLHVRASSAEVRFLQRAGHVVFISGGRRVCFFASQDALDTAEGLDLLFEKAVLHRRLFDEDLFVVQVSFPPERRQAADLYLAFSQSVLVGDLLKHCHAFLRQHGFAGDLAGFRLSSLGEELAAENLGACGLHHAGCFVTFGEEP